MTSNWRHKEICIEFCHDTAHTTSQTKQLETTSHHLSSHSVSDSKRIKERWTCSLGFRTSHHNLHNLGGVYIFFWQRHTYLAELLAGGELLVRNTRITLGARKQYSTHVISDERAGAGVGCRYGGLGGWYLNTRTHWDRWSFCGSLLWPRIVDRSVVVIWCCWVPEMSVGAVVCLLFRVNRMQCKISAQTNANERALKTTTNHCVKSDICDRRKKAKWRDGNDN